MYGHAILLDVVPIMLHPSLAGHVRVFIYMRCAQVKRPRTLGRVVTVSIVVQRSSRTCASLTDTLPEPWLQVRSRLVVWDSLDISSLGPRRLFPAVADRPGSCATRMLNTLADKYLGCWPAQSGGTCPDAFLNLSGGIPRYGLQCISRHS